MRSDLVSIGLPVRNAEHRVAAVVASVLAQDHERLEVVISDNASSDGTEEVCRQLARDDPRVVYRRQAENVGILRNFLYTLDSARGDYFRWISHDDSLAPHYVSRLLGVLVDDPRLVLVTSQISYAVEDGAVLTARYDASALRSDDPVDRFAEMLRLLTESFTLLDPHYALMRRALIAPIRRRNMLREDEVFAAKLALAGPWAHVPEVLATREWKLESQSLLADKLGVPAWQAHASWELQVYELLRAIRDADLDAAQQRAARAAVVRLYGNRHRRRIERGFRKVVRLTSARLQPTG